MNFLDAFLACVTRWAALGAFIMSVWSIAFASVGYAMYFMLAAIYFQLNAMEYAQEK
jgi:hypothetical protein